MTLPRYPRRRDAVLVREDKFIERLGLIKLEPEVPWAKEEGEKRGNGLAHISGDVRIAQTQVFL